MEPRPGQLLETVTKGKLALAKAQENIRKFEEHLKLGEGYTSNVPQNMMGIAPPLEEASSFEDDQLYIQDGHTHAIFDDTDFVIQQMVHAEHIRRERDTQIHLNYNMYQDHHLERKKVRDEGLDPQPFEPDYTLKHYKRAHQMRSDHAHTSQQTVVKVGKMLVDKRNTETESKKYTFKALPLPDGTLVKNDPYALTSAAMGKRIPAHIMRTGQATAKFIDGRPSTHRIDAAALLQRRGLADHSTDEVDLNDTHIYSSSTRSVSSSQLQAEQAEKIYQSLTGHVTVHEDGHDTGNSQTIDDTHNAVELQHHLSKLQSSLKLKHTKCIRVIEQLHQFDATNGILDENHNTSAMDQSSVRNCDDLLQSTDSILLSRNNSSSTEDCDNVSQSSNLSLYTRQRSWLSRVESRRLEAKQNREMQDMAKIQNFSISAVLKNTSRSWMMAKAAHDRAVTKAIQKEQHQLENRPFQDKLIITKLMDSVDSDKNKFPRKNIGKGGTRANFPQGDSAQLVAQHVTNLDNTDTANETTSLDRNISRYCQSNDLAPQKMASVDLKICHQQKESDSSEHSKDVVRCNNQGYESSTNSLSVNEARKVLLHKIVQRHTSALPCPTKAKKIRLSPYTTHHLKIHKKVVKNKRDVTNRFQSAAIQAKLYAELLSRSMNRRQSRMHTLTPCSNNYNQNKSATLPAITTDKEGKGMSNVHKDQGIVAISTLALSHDIEKKEEPYERYETGKAPFFDKSSSNDKGRFRVRDARYFAPDSIRRIAVPWDSRGTTGIMLLVGRKYTTSHDTPNLLSDEQVITVLFDRPKFDEDGACRWWQLNRRYIIEA